MRAEFKHLRSKRNKKKTKKKWRDDKRLALRFDGVVLALVCTSLNSDVILVFSLTAHFVGNRLMKGRSNTLKWNQKQRTRDPTELFVLHIHKQSRFTHERSAPVSRSLLSFSLSLSLVYSQSIDHIQRREERRKEWDSELAGQEIKCRPRV